MRCLTLLGDVYLLGVTNAGKSVLYNRLLASDYCHSLASEALTPATTSYWPNTTLNMLKFPVTELDEKKFELRRKRLYHDRVKEEEKNAERYLRFKKTHEIQDAALFGIVNTTFKPNSTVGKHFNTETEAAFATNEDGQFVAGESYGSAGDVRKEQIAEARGKYRPSMYKDSCFFYDTPGVLTNDHIFR
jgi:nitric oxide-associated protein 1